MQLDTTVYRVCEFRDETLVEAVRRQRARCAVIFARQPIEVTMNEHVQTANGEPLFNPLAPEFIRNPYPHYERLRTTDPMHLTPFGLFVASRHAEVSLVLRDKRFGKDFVERTVRRYGPQDHGRAGLPQHEPLDAAAGSARPHPSARPGGEGLHRAPRRGHAPAHPADRRRDARSRSSRRAHGPDRGFRLPPAGHHHLRHARHPRGPSRDLLYRFARRRAAARSGAAVAGGDQAGQRRQPDGADVFPAAVRVAAQATPATT